MSGPTNRQSIVFFGAGPVAAASLEFLAGLFDIEAVVTKARPPHHHGSVPVLEWCDSYDVRVHTPANKTKLSELFAIQPVTSAVGVVIDYGIIIAQDVIDTFPLGIVNSHFSLLPQWRGADPISFAILSGQPTTGVSLMLINDKMDEGPLLAQATYDVDPSETTPSLTVNLVELSNTLLAQTLPLYLADGVVPYEQTEESMTGIKLATSYSRKLTKDDGNIDWSDSASAIEREIRAYAEWPKCRVTLGDIDVVITRAHVGLVGADANVSPGTIMTENKTLSVRCCDCWLVIDNLKPAGKPEMTAEAFLAGYKTRLS